LIKFVSGARCCAPHETCSGLAHAAAFASHHPVLGGMIILYYRRFMTEFFILYIAVINALTYFLYWWDKRQAVWRGWRVPEAILLLAGAVGGSPAGFIARRKLGHKTRKQPFKMLFWLIVAAQLYLVMVYMNPPPV
jgi:uncharacterized membrane protein YsdA (DUF1294 family)